MIAETHFCIDLIYQEIWLKPVAARVAGVCPTVARRARCTARMQQFIWQNDLFNQHHDSWPPA